jgi:predicted acylesterase/phospholipase RssA
LKVVPTAARQRDYLLWQVVRASTAAPTYFDPETISISGAGGVDPVVGNFVDGGVSPFNNPALQALMYATLEGYRIGWPTGADRLLLVSVGSGSTDPVIRKSTLAASHAVGALMSVMRDCALLQETMLQWMSASATARSMTKETMLQWMSTSVTARPLDRELGDLGGDVLGGVPLDSEPLLLRLDLGLSCIISLAAGWGLLGLIAHLGGLSSLRLWGGGLPDDSFC